MEINKIHLGDSVDLMKTIDDSVIDLTVTSPPYDDLRTYKNTLIDWDMQKFQSIVNELYRITKDGGVVVWVVGDATIKGSESCNSFRQAIQFVESGFNLHDTMIYQKQNPVPNSGNRYQQCFEYMFVFSKGKPKTVNLLLEPRRYTDNTKHRIKKMNRGKDGEFEKSKLQFIKSGDVPKQNIWVYKVGLHHSTTDAIAFEHPATFPEKLAEDHILTWSNVGDLVFDPFSGSGTTPKMAKLNQRNYIACERVKEYFDISNNRVNATPTSKKKRSQTVIVQRDLNGNVINL